MAATGNYRRRIEDIPTAIKTLEDRTTLQDAANFLFHIKFARTETPTTRRHWFGVAGPVPDAPWDGLRQGGRRCPRSALLK